MAKTDLQIQSESGQLWIDLVPWRDASVAVVAAERDAALAKLDALESHLDKPDATIEDVKAEKEKTVKQRQRQALRDELDKINASKVEVQAKLDALDAKAGGAGK